MKSLYTQKEITEERNRLLSLQKNIDPILKEFIESKDAVCDHDHSSQHTRAALHRQTNAFEGLVFNAYNRCLKWVTDKPLSELLRSLADYLERDYSHNPYHPNWKKAVTTKFNKLSSSEQNLVLQSLCGKQGTNPAARKKLWSAIVKDRTLGYNTILETLKGLNNA